MPTKKYYTNGRREKNGGDNEIVGIILVIISAFILLCIVLPFILGVIGAVVKGIVVGILGLVAYPLFISTLILGVALIQDRKFSLSAKVVACVTISLIALVLLLHLAFSNKYLGEGYSSYVSSCYGNLTVGGVVFGTIVYGMQAVITPIATYVVCSLLVAVMLALMIVPLFRAPRERAPKTQPVLQPAPSPKFVKGQANAQQVKPITDNTLFVDSIIPSQNGAVTEQGSFSSMGMPTVNSASKAENSLLSDNGTGVVFESYNTGKTVKEDKYPTEAHRILFGDTDKYYHQTAIPTTKPSLSLSSEDMHNYFTSHGLSQPAPSTSVPNNSAVSYENKKPQKKEHFDPLPDVPVPPEKDYMGAFVGGEIINGDDVSRQIAEAMGETRVEKETRDVEIKRESQQPQVFDMRKIQPEPVVTRELPPITNGDYYGYPSKKTEQKIVETKRDVIQNNGGNLTPELELVTPLYARKENSYTVSLDDDFGVKNEQVDEEISAPQTAESRFEQLMREERKTYDSEPEYSEIDMQSDIEYAVEKTESAFEISNEVVDLSESSNFDGEDHTGYYEQVTGLQEPKLRVAPERPKTVKPARISDNQIKIEDYVAKTPIPEKPKKKRNSRYTVPPIELLQHAKRASPEEYDAVSQERARVLEETLKELKLPAKVSAITRGPAVTRYELEMPVGISVKKIETFTSDIEYNLAVNGKIRIETPIPGKRAVGIEVPNSKVDIVSLREIIESKEFQNASSPVTVALGKDIAGNIIVANLEKMPHLLIAGATGSGKSACLNSIIISLVYKSSPDDVRLMLIDPKRVEFNDYKGLPHLLTENIVNDAAEAFNALKWAREEMERRYLLFAPFNSRNIQEYNRTTAVKSGECEKLPYIVLIVDELAELMMSTNRKELEDKIMSMAQKARAAGIHLILATQRPSVDVITGTIKANLPSRIAFSVRSLVDSRTILDQMGAETLLGRGDMLYAPLGQDEPTRVQGAYVTTEEVVEIANYVRDNNECDFDDSVAAALAYKEEVKENESAEVEEDGKEFDDILPEVLKVFIEAKTASISMIQRRFSVGYARAARIIDQMEMHKFISPAEGSKPRTVYISREEFNEMFGGDL